jgi:Domain of unknown function (DUF1905)
MSVELEFSGEVIYWRGPSPFHFVPVPEAESAQIKAVSAAVTYGWGVIPVRASIGASEFTTSLFPKDGRYLLPLRAIVRQAQDLEVGDAVEVRLSIDL